MPVQSILYCSTYIYMFASHHLQHRQREQLLTKTMMTAMMVTIRDVLRVPYQLRCDGCLLYFL